MGLSISQIAVQYFETTGIKYYDVFKVNILNHLKFFNQKPTRHTIR